MFLAHPTDLQANQAETDDGDVIFHKNQLNFKEILGIFWLWANQNWLFHVFKTWTIDDKHQFNITFKQWYCWHICGQSHFICQIEFETARKFYIQSFVHWQCSQSSMRLLGRFGKVGKNSDSITHIDLADGRPMGVNWLKPTKLNLYVHVII